jgi:hypothetical protein
MKYIFQKPTPYFIFSLSDCQKNLQPTTQPDVTAQNVKPEFSLSAQKYEKYLLILGNPFKATFTNLNPFEIQKFSKKIK